MYKDNCRFCTIARGEETNSFDSPLLSNNEYFAIPSIGALVDGWTLVIPREHKCSMKRDYKNVSCASIINDVLTQLRTFHHGGFAIFEHSPSHENSLTSCGTNHAHLHIVPYGQSLIESSSRKWVECLAKNIPAIAEDHEYLFFCQLANNEIWDNPTGHIHLLEKPISQYFRRVISEQLGCPEKYDYKVFPNLEHVHATQRLFAVSVK